MSAVVSLPLTPPVEVLPAPVEVRRFGRTMMRVRFPNPYGRFDVLTVTVGAVRATLVYAYFDGSHWSVSGRSWPKYSPRPPVLAEEFAARVAAFVSSTG